MLAISIAIPTKNATINVAVADHVPVAELIPHLVEQEAELHPGQHWHLSRTIGVIRPEHSLAEAGVRPGELLTLDLAQVAAPAPEAIEELTGPVGANPALWVAAGIGALISIRSVPLFHPLDYHSWDRIGLLSASGQVDVSVLLTLVVTALGAFATAAGSLFDKRYCYIAALLGFGLGLHINVLCACVAASMLVWRPGPARIVTFTLSVFSAINVFPGLTLIFALITLAYAGQIAVVIARISLPRVPATGLFHEPSTARAGNVVSAHSSLIIAVCTVILACMYQLIPAGSEPSTWVVALAIVVALCGVSARGTRPIHATAVVSMSAAILVWLAWHTPLAIIALALVALPAIRVQSPMVGRLIDVVEALAFTAAIPLALHTTGIFELIRGIG